MDYRSTPSLQADMAVVEHNIREAVETLGRHGVAHRPHMKVHKSVALARLQQRLGCKGITCAKLGEAEVMADGGIEDILLAYPLIGSDKLERYRLLAGREGLTIRTIINSIAGAEGLSRLGGSLGKRLPVLIELDGGINRGGVKLGDPLKEFARQVKDLPGIEIVGVEYYGGDIYGCKNGEEIRARARRERDEIVRSGALLRAMGFDIQILSGGSSFSLRFPEELEGLTEVRAGNYIFNDNALFSIGVVPAERCALRVYSTVVSRPDEHTMIIDAGSKTLTTDTVGARAGYGYLVESPDAVIYKVNEEHGFVHSDAPLPFQIGDVVSIIPNHACTLPNLCDEFYGVRGGVLDQVIRVDARGKNR